MVRRPSGHSRLILALVTVVFAWTVFQYGGVRTGDWNWTVAALSVIAIVYWSSVGTSRLAPPLEGTVFRAFVAAPIYVAAQLIPWPVDFVRVVSPSRVALAGHAAWLPISINSGATLAHLVRLMAYILTFFLARELSWRLGRKRWLVAAPLLAMGIAEAGGGLLQHFSTGSPARGNYVNANHLAGLLEMCLPFSVMAIFVRRDAADSINQALRTCVAILLSAILFLGIIYSLSRMGLLAALAGLTLLAGMEAARRRRKTAFLLLFPISAGLVLILTVPGQFLDRLQSPASNELTNAGRLEFWKETIRLIGHYPLFGTGLGTFVSAIQQYRESAPLNLLDYAHNDYLQWSAELGLVGFLPFFLIGLLFLRRTYTLAATEAVPGSRYLAMGCAAALTAIALHEIVDFNLYIPANAMFAAWIAGMASSLELSPERLARREIFSVRGKRVDSNQVSGRTIPSIV